jgi:FkbM family methyltransferase
MRRWIVAIVRAIATNFARLFCLTHAGSWSAEVLRVANETAYTVCDEHEYQFVATSPLLLWRAQTLFTKEPETIAWIRTFLATDIFFDIGANVGTYTIYAASRCKQVFAFEPEASNYKALNQNIRLNSLGERARAFPFAIAETMRIDSLRLHSTDAGAALHVFGRNTDFKSDRFVPVFEQGAVAITLDQLVFDLGLPVPTQIKIDVDGLEAEILQGAPRVLARRELRGLLLEINENQKSDVTMVEYLASLGFRVACKGAPVIDTTGHARMVNYVFDRR